MARTTQKQQQRISFVFKYIHIVKRDGVLPREKELGQTKSNITYWSRKLCKLGILQKTDKSAGLYKVLKTDEDIQKILIKIYTKNIIVTTTKKKPNNAKYKRVHSIQFKISLPKYSHWITSMQKYLDKKEIPYIITKKGQFKLSMTYQGLRYTFLICKNTIIGYIPTGKDFIADDALFAVEMAKAHIREVAFAFNTYLGRDLRYKGDIGIHITRHHIAMMDNPIAKKLHKEKKEIKVYIDGKLRVITDKSFNWDETEAITRNRAVSDVEALEDHIADVVTHKHTISDVKAELQQEVHEMRKLVLEQQKALNMLLRERNKSIDFNSFKY